MQAKHGNTTEQRSIFDRRARGLGKVPGTSECRGFSYVRFVSSPRSREEKITVPLTKGEEKEREVFRFAVGGFPHPP